MVHQLGAERFGASGHRLSVSWAGGCQCCCSQPGPNRIDPQHCAARFQNRVQRRHHEWSRWDMDDSMGRFRPNRLGVRRSARVYQAVSEGSPSDAATQPFRRFASTSPTFLHEDAPAPDAGVPASLPRYPYSTCARRSNWFLVPSPAKASARCCLRPCDADAYDARMLPTDYRRHRLRRRGEHAVERVL